MLGAEARPPRLVSWDTAPTPSRFSPDAAAELVPGAQGHLETLMDSTEGPSADKGQHFSDAQALPEAPTLPCTPTAGSAPLWQPWV